MSTKSFIEIEHKFLVDSSFDPKKFRKKLLALKPVKHYSVLVKDVYFLLNGIKNKNHIFRYRKDAILEQLTVKNLSKDPEKRTEINLDLLRSKEGQLENIEQFFKLFSIRWRGDIVKDVQVFYFKDCEIVFYKAFTKSKKIDCVEFEARDTKDIVKARKILQKYEVLLGFDAKDRAKDSLPKLLFPKIFLGQ